MVSSSSQSPSKVGISRRAVTTGLAWSVPAIVLAAPAVAAAASTPSIELVNLGTVDDYVGVSNLSSLGGSERFYEYGVSYTESDNYSTSCASPAETDDFRYRLRVRNSGSVPVVATETNPIEISFRYPQNGPFYGGESNTTSSYDTGKQAFVNYTLVDAYTNGTVDSATGLQSSTSYDVATNETYGESGSKARYQPITIKLWGFTLQPDEYVQISPDWQMSGDMMTWTHGRPTPVTPVFFAWLTTFTVAMDGASVTRASLDKTYFDGGVMSGAWSFDGGIARPYGYNGKDGEDQTCPE